VLKCGNKIQVKINFRQQLLRLDSESLILDFSSIKSVKADLVIGCDGAFSKTRTEIMKYFSGKLVQETFQHQYREFKIPSNLAFSPKKFLHIWPRRNLLLIAFTKQR
jgi:kynurenine 3-monooxygenase